MRRVNFCPPVGVTDTCCWKRDENRNRGCGKVHYRSRVLNLNPTAHQLVSSHADTMGNGFLEGSMAFELFFKEILDEIEAILDEIKPSVSRETEVKLDDVYHRLFCLRHTLKRELIPQRSLLFKPSFERKPAIIIQEVSRFNLYFTDESHAQGSKKVRKHRDSLPAIMIKEVSPFNLYFTDESHAQGSKKEGERRGSLPAIMGRKGKTSDYSDSWGFSCNSTSDVSLKARDHSTNEWANMKKGSSWITVLTCPWWLLLSNYRQSLERKPAVMRSSSKTSYYSNSWGFSSHSASDLSLKAGDHSMNNRANMQKASSWITVLTFPWCLLQSNYGQSRCNEQRSLSVWHALLGMINFTAFLSSLFLMAICGAHFTRLQISVLLISSTIIIMDAYVTVLGLSN